MVPNKVEQNKLRKEDNAVDIVQLRIWLSLAEKKFQEGVHVLKLSSYGKPLRRLVSVNLKTFYLKLTSAKVFDTGYYIPNITEMKYTGDSKETTLFVKSYAKSIKPEKVAVLLFNERTVSLLFRYLRMIQQPINQVRLTNVAIVRYKCKGKRFEVACYKNKLLNWRSGAEMNIDEVLQSRTLYQNVCKGQLANVKNLAYFFGTDNQSSILKIILEKGELQISQKERQAEVDNTFNEICSAISRKVYNKHTNLPLPATVIKDNLQALGFSVNLNLSVKQQSLKGIKMLTTKYKNDLCKVNMFLQIFCSGFQRKQILLFLVVNCKALIKQEYTIVYENQLELDLYTITFSSDFINYNSLVEYSSNLKPICQLQILSDSYIPLNVESIFHISESSNCQFIETTQSRNDANWKSTKTSENSSYKSGNCVLEGQSIYCTKCNCYFNDTKAFRLHCKTNWHIHNTSKQLKFSLYK